MQHLIIFKADTPTTIANFMAKPPLMIRADNNERAVPMLEAARVLYQRFFFVCMSFLNHCSREQLPENSI